MNTYIYYANTQYFTTIFSSLIILLLTGFLLTFKDKLANCWYTFSAGVGIFTFVLFYTLTINTNAVGFTEGNNGIYIVWYTCLILFYCQFISFVTGFIIYIYNSCPIYFNDTMDTINGTVSNNNNVVNKGKIMKSTLLFVFLLFLFQVIIWGVIGIMNSGK